MVTPVLVVWHDAHADRSRWEPVDELDDDGPYEVLTLGFLIPKAKKGHVTIAQSISGEVVDSLLHIPAKMVVRIVEVGQLNESPPENRPAHSPLFASSDRPRV